MPDAAVLNIGLIGCGAVASFCHMPALRRLRSVRVVAVADIDADARTRMERQYRVDTHARYDDLLARPELHAVVISVPPSEHAAVALAAAAAGKPFYLEKPIATSLAEARSVTTAAAAARVTTAMGFNRRLHPLYLQAAAMVRDGTIGRVRAVQMTFCEPAPPQGLPSWKLTRAGGGGALLDLASHHIDLLRWILRDEVDAVEARVTSEVSEDDAAFLHLTLRSGARAQGFYSFRAAWADHLEFVGERGTLRVDRHRATLSVRRVRDAGYGTRTHWPAPTPAVAAWWLRRIVRRYEDPSYYHALQAFARQLDGGPALTATLEDGYRSLEIVLAAEESARSGTVLVPRA